MQFELSDSEIKPFEMSSKKAAVRNGLALYLQGHQLEEAMRHWEAHYSHLPAYALQRFLRDMCQSFGLTEDRNRILRSIIAQLGESAAERRVEESRVSAFEEDLEANTPRRRKTSGAMVVFGSDEIEPMAQAFQFLMPELSTTAVSAAGEKIQEYVQENVVRSHIPSEVKQTVVRWLSGERTPYQLELKPKHMRELVGIYYAGLCAYVGPVDADRLLSTSVHVLTKRYPGVPFDELL